MCVCVCVHVLQYKFAMWTILTDSASSFSFFRATIRISVLGDLQYCTAFSLKKTFPNNAHESPWHKVDPFAMPSTFTDSAIGNLKLKSTTGLEQNYSYKLEPPMWPTHEQPLPSLNQQLQIAHSPTISIRWARATPSCMSHLRSSISLAAGFFFSWALTHTT